MPTIGTTVYGKPAVACPHWAQTWPLVNELWGLRFPAAHRLEIVQALGSAAASAGTHGSPGTCLDLRTYRYTSGQIAWLVQMLRNAGADATWYRNWVGNRHIHSALDCPCVSPADYQITAVRQGYDGLGAGGRKGRDDGPPVSRRNHAAGLAWLRSEIARYNPQSEVLGTNQEDTMTPDQEKRLYAHIDKVAQQVHAFPINRTSGPIAFIQEIANQTATLAALRGEIAGLTKALEGLAAGRVDMAAVTKAARDGAAEGVKALTLKAG